MLINKQTDNGTLTAELSGRLDSAAAPACEEELLPALEEADKLVLDLNDLEYVSSAGLRIFLLCQKKMAPKGGMVLLHVNESIRDVLDITGFTDILTIGE